MEKKELKLGCKKCGYPGHFTYEVGVLALLKKNSVHYNSQSPERGQEI
jgi:hypothetical protein